MCIYIYIYIYIHRCVYIYIYIYIYVLRSPPKAHGHSELRLGISEGLTQAEYMFKGCNSQIHRGFPRIVESRNCMFRSLTLSVMFRTR